MIAALPSGCAARRLAGWVRPVASSSNLWFITLLSFWFACFSPSLRARGWKRSARVPIPAFDLRCPRADNSAAWALGNFGPPRLEPSAIVHGSTIPHTDIPVWRVALVPPRTNSKLKNSISCSSRGNEAHISSGEEGKEEPRYLGYFISED